MAVPFLLILINSFKSPTDYNTSGPLVLPTELYFDGIVNFWNRVDFPEKLWNSFLISGSVAVLAVALSVINAYALGIGRVKYRTGILLLFLLADLIPQEALLYPLYYMFKSVGLYDTQLAIIIIFTVIQAAFGTYLLSSVFGTFPKELLEAAALDGAGKIRTLVRVVLPITQGHAVGAAHLLLHLDVERVPDPAHLPGVERQPDGAGGDHDAPGRPADGCHDHECLGAARRHPDAHLLPHLPAHAHARHHRRRGQVTRMPRHPRRHPLERNTHRP